MLIVYDLGSTDVRGGMNEIIETKDTQWSVSKETKGPKDTNKESLPHLRSSRLHTSIFIVLG